jgi:hypothetical protein
MIRYLYDLLAAASGGVLLLVFIFLLRGPARKFVVVLIYVGWALLSGLGLTLADFLYYHDAPPEQRVFYEHLYWTNEVAADLLQFLLVVVLTCKAAPEALDRRRVGRLLAGVAVVAMALPFLLLHPAFTPWPTNQWFNSTGEILHFGAAIMNLVLWATLIASRQRDPQLLTVSAGLGVLVTGTAIGYGLRHFIPLGALRTLPNLFVMLSQLGGWTIWCWAFWPAPKPRRAPSEAFTSIEGRT